MVEMRKRTILVALAVIAVGLIATGVSTLYERREFIGDYNPAGAGMSEFSYGFPLGWYGYSQAVGIIFSFSPKLYWFWIEPFLLDAAFWIAISAIGCLVIIKSMNMLHKTRASKNLSVINV